MSRLNRYRRAPAYHEIRDAGPAAMRDPVDAWDAIDEQADESFPASDPPSLVPARADHDRTQMMGADVPRPPRLSNFERTSK